MTRHKAWTFPILAAVIAASGATARDFDSPLVPALVTAPASFIGITPCRIADTRDANFPAGYGPPSLTPGAPRNFTIAGQCGIPQGAVAVSLNVTAVSPHGFGYVLLYPQGGPQPGVSTLNFVTNQTVANAALVPLGAGGGITVATAVSITDFLIDVNGYYAGSATDASNVFIGYEGGNASTTGTKSTAIGFNTFPTATTGYGTAAGDHALWIAESAATNVAIGASALYATLDGHEQVGFGKGAVAQNASSFWETAVGAGALALDVGYLSTAIGSGALSTTLGGHNAALGYLAGASHLTGGSNLYIANPGAADEESTVRIGSVVQTRAFLAGVRGVTAGPGPLLVVVDPGGQLGTPVSSIRYKEDVADASSASGRLLGLRPVSYRYKNQEDDRPQYGLIAEEVERVLPELVVCDPSGETRTVLYDEIPALLLAELQKQKRRLTEGQKRLEARREALEHEEAAVAAREREVEELERQLRELAEKSGSRDGRQS
jgi:hypothetical protein